MRTSSFWLHIKNLLRVHCILLYCWYCCQSSSHTGCYRYAPVAPTVTASLHTGTVTASSSHTGCYRYAPVAPTVTAPVHTGTVTASPHTGILNTDSTSLTVTAPSHTGILPTTSGISTIPLCVHEHSAMIPTAIYNRHHVAN